MSLGIVEVVIWEGTCRQAGRVGVGRCGKV